MRFTMIGQSATPRQKIYRGYQHAHECILYVLIYSVNRGRGDRHDPPWSDSSDTTDQRNIILFHDNNNKRFSRHHS